MTSLSETPTRRRAITIFAAAAAGAVIGGPARSDADYEWHGVAMGADATILFNGIDRDDARRAVDLVESEINRLEDALSLFRRDSELSRLNRDGLLASPTADLRRALTLAIDMSAASGGLFDPTVQALWEAHVDWFSAAPGAGTPPEELIAQARNAVDWRKVTVAHDSIGLGRGQRLTLNGMGQGSLGARLDGNPWQIARAGAAPVRLQRGALATSEGAGCVLGAGGAAHHLFDPRSGRSATSWNAVTVYHHRSAAIADALSTTCYVASAAEIAAFVARFPGTVVWAREQGAIDRRWISAPIDGVPLHDV